MDKGEKMKKRNLALGILLILSVISPSLFGDVLYEQPVNWSGDNAYLIVTSSGNDYIFHERYNFGGFTGSLNEIEIWLLNTSGTFEALDFTITFTPNNVDRPDIGNEVATYNISGVSSVDTGQLYLGFQVHSYTIPLSSPFDTSTAEWFSMDANTTTDYYWIFSATGDGTCYDQYYDDNAGGDLAFVFDDDAPLPVNLSSFYALYTGGTPTLYWTTQTEENNAYWNVYRGTTDNFETAVNVNANSPVLGNGTTNMATDYIYTDNVPVVQNATYWYWIEDVSTDGETTVHDPITLSIPFEDTPVTPDSYGLNQNYPNPFNPSTSISFALAEDSNVELIIYNIKGEKVKTIFNDLVYADQINYAIWNGEDAYGKQVSGGVYLYKLKTGTREYNKKMIMVK